MARSRTAKKGKRSTAKRGASSARTSRSSSRRSTKSAGSARSKRGNGREDAISLLKSDHREVERMFEQFSNSRSQDKKSELSKQICLALRTHTTIEEEIFYPAFLEATDDTEIHHEAEIEHEGAKHLIEEIEAAGPDDDHFDARVSVLQEMIRHHVKEEEQRGGMFAKAQSSDMDLQALGRQLSERKLELLGERAESSDEAGRSGRRQPPDARSRRTGRDLRARSS